MAPEKRLPFWSRVTFSETGVLEAKNFSQFAVIWATAPEVFVAAGADVDAPAAADVAVGADDELEEELELLHAATAAASASASAGARTARRARAVNPMTPLLSLGRRYWSGRHSRSLIRVSPECFPRSRPVSTASRRARQGGRAPHRPAAHARSGVTATYQRKCTKSRPKFLESFSTRWYLALISSCSRNRSTCFLSAPEPLPGIISTSGAFLASASSMIARSARSMSCPRL